MDEQVFTACLLISTAIVAFLLGQQSVLSTDQKALSQIVITNNDFTAVTTNTMSQVPLATQSNLVEQTSAAITTSKEYVASRSGTRYHHISCAGAKQIKEENKIYFANPSAAEAAGYTRAVNCPQ